MGLIQEYPELFGTAFDPKETLIGFGLEIGPGWEKILADNLPELSKIVKDSKLDDFRIIQVKEKFGGLRIYTNYSIKKIDDWVEKMEILCSESCEKCGAPAQLYADGWWRTLCDECEGKV
jgi:hypothetical protein